MENSTQIHNKETPSTEDIVIAFIEHASESVARGLQNNPTSRMSLYATKDTTVGYMLHTACQMGLIESDRYGEIMERLQTC